jgi:hypothetical protein
VSTPTEFLEWLSTDAPVWRALPAGDAANAALDRRDAPETEQAWLREDGVVRRLLQATSIPTATIETIAAIAEKAFIRTFEIAQHHELAAQVSDDLRLLAEAAAVGHQSATLDRLWGAYFGGRFPDHLR